MCASTSCFLSSSTSTIPSGPCSIETDGTHSLESPLFGHMDPVVVETQSMPGLFDLERVDDFLLDNDNGCTSAVFDLGSEIDTSSAAAPWRVEDLTHRTASLDNRPYKRRRNLKSSHDTSELMVKSLSQNVLCEDYYSILESKLPRWTREGLWHETPQKLREPNSSIRPTRSTSPPLSSYSKLERAYLAVCQLNSRMGDDVVRNRVALIQLHLEYTEMQQGRRHTSGSNRMESTVGRGHASHAIDRILESIHEGWRTLDQRRRAELRAKFHDKKKCGKRWSQLANALGPGILLICSTKLASAV